MAGRRSIAFAVASKSRAFERLYLSWVASRSRSSIPLRLSRSKSSRFEERISAPTDACRACIASTFESGRKSQDFKQRRPIAVRHLFIAHNKDPSYSPASVWVISRFRSVV